MEITNIRAETLAQRLEEATETLLQIVESCTEAQWQALCPNEERTVGVMVHHIAAAAPLVVGWAAQVGNGQPVPVSLDRVHAGNAVHAAENQSCSKAETVALLRQNSAQTANTIRQLSDEQLERTAPMALFGGQSVNAQMVIEMVLIGHVHGYPHSHLPNIRVALGV